jgi:uncharacterized protein YxjI
MTRNRSNKGLHRYLLKQKIVSIGDDFYIENERGEQVFHIDGKILTIRDTLIFKDMHGRELCHIKEKLVKVRDTMYIENPDGKVIATIKKDLINVFRDHWTVKIENGLDLEIKGNVLDYDYRIREGRHDIARVSKKFFQVRDSYGIEIQTGQNDILILAIAVALDMMVHS